MKYLLVFVTLLAVGLSDENTKYFLYENDNGEILIEDLTVAPNYTATAADLTYFYYSQSNPENGVGIKAADIGTLRNTHFQASKDTIFIIHGWKNSHESDVNSHIRENIIKGHDINIFVVDWSPAAGKNYVSAQGSVVRVGQFVADFINSLVSTYKINLDNVKFVGHSLGAHISGNAGAALKGRVDRIVGLDPAGPLFSVKNTDNRLDPTDAKFVQAIHTNDGKLALNTPMGHADYYPNGGKSQPGCGLDLTGSCAHSRAYSYYAESLNSEKFVSTKCGNYNDFTKGNCKTNAASSMGMFNVDTRASGGYYLTTNSAAPFAKG